MKRRTLLAGLASLSLLPALPRVTMADPVKAWRPVFHTKSGGNQRALQGYDELVVAEWDMRALVAFWRYARSLTPEPSVIVTLDGEIPYAEFSHYTIEPDEHYEWMAELDRLPACIDDPPTLTPAYYRAYAAGARQREAAKTHATAWELRCLACAEIFAITMERTARGGTTFDHEHNRFCLRQQELGEHFNICPWDGIGTVHGYRHDCWKTISWLS